MTIRIQIRRFFTDSLYFYQLIFCLSLFFLFTNESFGQNKLTIEKGKVSINNTSYDIPGDKVLLIFNSTEELSFKSQRNNSALDAIQSNGEYLLYINPVADIITILTRMHGLSCELRFSNDNSQNISNLFPVPHAGEKLYFVIKPSFQLIVGNSEGDPNLTHKNALIVVKSINNLELNFTSNKKVVDIIDKRKDEGKYLVYLEPGKQTFTIESKYYEGYQLSFEDLKSYPVQYYSVSAPDTAGFYSIKSSPSGALVKIQGLTGFNSQQNLTPLSFNKRCGHYNIILTLPKYDTIKDEIDICDPVKKESDYFLVPSFSVVRLKVQPALDKIKVMYKGQEIHPFNSTDFEFPKGEVQFLLQSPGYKSDTTILNLSGGDTIPITKYMIPLKGMDITIFTNPKNVLFQLENGDIKSKRSPISVKLCPGEYKLFLSNELYNPLTTELKIVPGQTGYYYDLTPKVFYLTLQIKGRIRDSYTIYIDGKPYNITAGESGYFSKGIAAGNHQLEVRSEKSSKIVFKSKVNQTNSNSTKIIWLPSRAAWSVGGIGCSTPTTYFSNAFQNNFKEPTVYTKPTFFLNFMVLSMYGLSIQPVQIENSNSSLFPDNPYLVTWINPEFRIGFNITNWMDFSLFVNAYYKNNPFFENKTDKQATFFDIRGYKYGLAFNFFPHNKNRWSWASMTLRAGVRDENIQYHIWDGIQALPTHNITEYNMFISIALNVITCGDGMVLRVFKKPLSQAGGL
jgi:hypothetical protein